jgi:hypothetical protein
MFENSKLVFFHNCLGNENLILHGIIRNEVIPWGVEVHIYACTDVVTYYRPT